MTGEYFSGALCTMPSYLSYVHAPSGDSLGGALCGAPELMGPGAVTCPICLRLLKEQNTMSDTVHYERNNDGTALCGVATNSFGSRLGSDDLTREVSATKCEECKAILMHNGFDVVQRPEHYNSHPVCEAIELVEELSFNLGCCLKYVWRVGKKSAFGSDHAELEDLKKAKWYLDREIARQRRVSLNGNNEIANDEMPFGIPRSAKKLCRVIGLSDATKPVMRALLESLANDRVHLDEAVAILTNAIQAIEDKLG